MRMRFQGLIVHASVPANPEGIPIQLAVLMQHGLHHPLMTVNNADIQSGTTAVGTRTQQVTCFVLRNRISNSLGMGVPATLSLASIPSLRVLTSGTTPHPNVLTRTSHSNFHAYVELPPGGILRPEDFFVANVAFNGTPFGCLARTVAYDFAPPGNVTFVIDGKSLVLAPGAIIRISNREHEKEAAPSDYEAYRSFFDVPPPSIHHPVVGTACDQGSAAPPERTCGEEADLEADCSNTRYP